MDHIKGVQLTVKGIVQEVGYRFHTQLEAQRLGLVGFVKNQTDKSVYVEAYGDLAACLRLIDWCRGGSPNAQVKELVITYLTEGQDMFSHFSIQSS